MLPKRMLGLLMNVSLTCSRLWNKLQLYGKVYSNSSILGTERTCRRHVVIDKKLDEIGDRLLTFSRK
jgi:hypothetical protein